MVAIPSAVFPRTLGFEQAFGASLWSLDPVKREAARAFFAFLGTARAIADDPRRTSAEKAAMLQAMDAALDGTDRDEPWVRPALKLKRALGHGEVPLAHVRHVMQANLADAAATRRFQDWSDLYNYCRFRAAPVGRFLLDLHGEGEAARLPMEGLCTAAQVTGLALDAARDFREWQHTNLPQRWLDEAGIDETGLAAPRASRELLEVYRRLASRVRDMLVSVRALPGRIEDPGLRRETAIAWSTTARLAGKLGDHDPVARGLGLGRFDRLLCNTEGLLVARRLRSRQAAG